MVIDTMHVYCFTHVGPNIQYCCPVLQGIINYVGVVVIHNMVRQVTSPAAHCHPYLPPQTNFWISWPLFGF